MLTGSKVSNGVRGVGLCFIDSEIGFTGPIEVTMGDHEAATLP